MIPILTRIRAKSLSEFGDLVRHSGEEYIHVLEGHDRRPHRILRSGRRSRPAKAIYIDSNMGHAYVAAEDCDEALVLGVCSSDDEALMSSLMHIHEPPGTERGPVANEPGPRVRTLRRPAA